MMNKCDALENHKDRYKCSFCWSIQWFVLRSVRLATLQWIANKHSIDFCTASHTQTETGSRVFIERTNIRPF